MDRPHHGPAGPARAGGMPVTADRPAVMAAPGTAKIIEARDLVKSFGEAPALRGASLRVRQGEIVAVMALSQPHPGRLPAKHPSRPLSNWREK